MMTAMEAPIPAEKLRIVPANEASWDDLRAIFGTADADRWLYGSLRPMSIAGVVRLWVRSSPHRPN